jgi:chromosomal replication initiation ATPase DnaA
MQLPLPFEHHASYGEAEFLADACNADALAWLDVPWPGNRLAVWGAPGSGKTHLLHVWAQRTGATWASGRSLQGLVRLPATGGLALDDADSTEPEPLLHLLNAAAEAGLPVLLAAPLPPARWVTSLPDLASRLRAVTAVELQAPGEEMLRTLFASLLAARQLAVPETVQNWLLARLPREPAALREAAARLDQVSLAAGRRVTQALAAEVLVADEAIVSDLGCAGAPGGDCAAAHRG